ncbi:peptidoglycan-binding domain-containing protein, partial [Parvibaculum sp.]|uniref:peptidoglycan-binding domain-containing protein n=1 Tax=Parvibaculum sp. TaxID=2024848 RepID=UPI002C2AF2CB
DVDAKTTRLAKADAASLKKPARETAARTNKTVAAAPSKPVASQTAAHHRNEPDEAEIEAMAERQSGPVALAPGPRMLDASPAIPASLPTRMNGDLIYDVQSKLMRLGYSPGPIDGTFSPQTRNAVLHFQNDMGLRPTGEIDAELLSRLRTTRQVDLRFVRGPMPLSQ